MPAMPDSSSQPPTEYPLLQLEGITKHFSGVAALSSVDVRLKAGTVHALVGENGAGKSTLIKIMTGALQPDAGVIRLQGRPVQLRSPQQAQAAGIAAVYQEIHLLKLRTVAENIYFGREPLRFGLIDWKRMNQQAGEVLAGLGLDIAPEAIVGDLNISLRQMVCIARCVSLSLKIVVLDEPTSSLSVQEVSVLYDLIRRLKAQGIGVIYVSHRLDELYAICEEVTVLRDGRLAGTHKLSELDRTDLVCLMLGKQRGEKHAGLLPFHSPRAAQKDGTQLLRADGLTRRPRLNNITVEVQSGQIVGLAGLLGSGRSEAARVIFGVDRADGGAVYFEGVKTPLRSPRDAINKGVGFVSEDRKTEGILPHGSVAENLTIAVLPLISRLGFISRRREREVVTSFIERLRIKISHPAQKIIELSGGNQQKVLLARWLCRNPKLLILDEPTRGIDLGARAEIHSFIKELAEAGLGVLMISSEIEELIEACSRIVVLCDGWQTSDLEGDEISEGALIDAMAKRDG
jgi:monosaccharide-transporting ATPase